MTNPTQNDLDDLLARTATHQPTVPSDLMARVMIDARQEQPRVVVAQKHGVWSALLELVGGWPAVGGLAMTGVAGIWIGIAPPVGLETMAADVMGVSQTVDLFGSDPFDGFTDGLDG